VPWLCGFVISQVPKAGPGAPGMIWFAFPQGLKHIDASGVIGTTELVPFLYTAWSVF